MTLKQCQEEVDKFMSQYRDGYWDPQTQVVCLVEEVGEIAKEVNGTYGPKTKKVDDKDADLGMEIADVIFVLCCLANSLDIDLDESWKNALQKFHTRDKDRFERA